MMPTFEIIRVMLNKFNNPMFQLLKKKYYNNYACYKKFSHAVAENIKNLDNIDKIYAYEGAALEIFKVAKTKGIKCIYELPTLYWKHREAIYKKQIKLNPKYKKLFNSEDNKYFANRVDEEIDLADQIIVPSLQAKNSLKLHHKKKLKINILNYPFPKPLNTKNKVWYNKKRKIEVMFVGMLEARKGLHYLIELLDLIKKNKQFVNFNFTIIGNGTMIDNVSHYLKDINFYPTMSNKHVLKKMRNCDILLSLSLIEGYALVPTEAMSMGMTVISSKYCGFTDKCNRKDVIVLENLKPKKIYNYLIKLKSNPQLIKKIGIKALKTCEMYQLKHYKKDLRKLLYK